MKKHHTENQIDINQTLEDECDDCNQLKPKVIYHTVKFQNQSVLAYVTY